MIPKEYIGKTRTTKWQGKKQEYTVICNYPDKEHSKIINERVATFYRDYFLEGHTHEESKIVIPVLKRCCELEKQGFDHDEMKNIILKEWEEKGLIKIPNDKIGDRQHDK